MIFIIVLFLRKEAGDWRQETGDKTYEFPGQNIPGIPHSVRNDTNFVIQNPNLLG